jgi:cephalosporin hydroxylase
METNKRFEDEVAANVRGLAQDTDLHHLSLQWIQAVAPHKYSYNFSWLGRPIIQFPQDMVAFQEIVWRVKPDLIIETGIAHGGSLVMSASLLAMLDVCEAVERGEVFDPKGSRRKVLGIDIDIRRHNLTAIQGHPMASWIQMIEGSSISPDVIKKVNCEASDYRRILVCLDSNHTHDHVLAELNAYAPLTSLGSYCVVFDTAIEDMPRKFFENRAWGPGNSPKSAVHTFLGDRSDFEINQDIVAKLQISVAPDGYLKRIA